MIHLRPMPAMFTSIFALALAACAVGQPGATPLATGSPTGGSPTGAAATSLAPAASTAAGTCAAPATPTISQTEGPYFKAGSPERSALVEPGMSGTLLTFTGYVVDSSCNPIEGAVVDIWQADAEGTYDNVGYRLRGHVATDASGRFTFETIIPGEYPGRTEHIHVKVTPPGGSTLTTQMYFPGMAANGADGIFSSKLLLTMTPAGDGYIGTFTFVLAPS